MGVLVRGVIYKTLKKPRNVTRIRAYSNTYSGLTDS